MRILSFIYLGYMFVSIYFMSLFLLLFKRNRKVLFDYPKTKKKYSISVLVPAFNEENTIEDTVKAIFDTDYKYLEEIIILNDGSVDNTAKIVRKLMKKYKRLKLVDKENSGKGDSLNQGLKIAKGELFAVVDADSFPSKDSFGKMIGFFDDEKVGAVTCVFVPRNRNKFIEKLQTIEYNIIAFTRKLLDYVDAIYVTPGPLALYRKSALDKIGGFDPNSMTEDIEATWNLAYHGYNRRMCLDTHATTTVPSTIKTWCRQRRRWNIGGLECISKYKKVIFQRGILGFFILPFFIFQLFLGLVGLSVFIYLNITKFIKNYTFLGYSINVGTSVTLSDYYFTPSVLNYLGVVLFVAGGLFTIFVLIMMKDKILKKQNIFNILFYLIFYLSIYPLIMISGLYNYFKGTRKWR